MKLNSTPSDLTYKVIFRHLCLLRKHVMMLINALVFKKLYNFPCAGGNQMFNKKCINHYP